MLKIILIWLNFLLQWKPPWDTGIPPEEMFEGPSLVLWVFAWIFFSLGLVSLLILVLYTKYGRETSIKLSAITIITTSVFFGFAFHFFLLNFGL
ncbi:MAG: hypothetical protein EU548_02080 [Promethearchaeota archaeon]|nr:MAG: hypothetical protein EU548_02080 [Candidatus Lokiarchaeota archaeon]